MSDLLIKRHSNFQKNSSDDYQKVKNLWLESKRPLELSPSHIHSSACPEGMPLAQLQHGQVAEKYRNESSFLEFDPLGKR